MEKLPELQPRPNWQIGNSRRLGDYLILIMTRGSNQIINIQGSKFQKNTGLGFARFDNKMDLRHQFRHEIIHPIAWKIALNIFTDQTENYSKQVEFVASGVDLFISGDDIYVAAIYDNKLAQLYNFIFQMAISQAMEDLLGTKKEEFTSMILDLAKKSEELYMKNDDFCLDYRLIFGYLKSESRETLISESMILRQIKEIISKIKEENSFESFDLLNFKKDRLPSIEDFLEIFKYKHEGYNYGCCDIFNSFKYDKIISPKEIWDKYKNEES